MLKLYFERYPANSEKTLQKAMTFLNGMFHSFRDSPVEKRRGVVDVFIVDEIYKLILITVKTTTDDPEGNIVKDLDIFHFSNLVFEKLYVSPNAFSSTEKLLNDAGHEGLLTVNHPVKSYDFLRDMIYDQIFDNTFDYYDPVFRRIQPLARRETTKVPQELVDHMVVFDDQFLANTFDKWRRRYTRQEVIEDLAEHLSIFFAGNVENWRDHLQLKIDLQPDLVRLRKKDNPDISESMTVFFEAKKNEYRYIPRALIGNAPSAVVQFWDDTDPRLRYVSIIESAVGFEVQAKNTIVNYDTPPTESLMSDKLLSTAVHGLQFIFRNIKTQLEFEFLTVPSVSHFSAYLQGRLLNLGRKSVNSIVNLVHGDRILNYLFTEEAAEFRTSVDGQLALPGGNLIERDQTRLHLLRETDSGQYTNTNLLLAFSNKIVDQEFVRQFLMNNLEGLGLQESMYCHFVRVAEGEETSFETTTFFLNQHLAARINREMNPGYENFQQGDVEFPFVAQLEPLADTNNLLKKAFREPSLPASAHLDLLIHLSIKQLKNHPAIIWNQPGDLLGYLAGGLSADCTVTSPDKLTRPYELKFETTEVLPPIRTVTSSDKKDKQNELQFETTKENTKTQPISKAKLGKTVTYTFTRKFELARDTDDLKKKVQAYKSVQEARENHKEVIYYKNAANEWRLYFC